MPKHFIKVKENFVCEACGTKIEGTGYTNHCPNCLYSKHVDKNLPGDRDSPCQGLMKPIGIETKEGKTILIHKCKKCGKLVKNRVSEVDSFEKILELSSRGEA